MFSGEEGDIGFLLRQSSAQPFPLREQEVGLLRDDTFGSVKSPILAENETSWKKSKRV
jgi:hypothetical protein